MSRREKEKIKTIVGATILFAGVLMIIGSVGGFENNSISAIRMAVQTIIGAGAAYIGSRIVDIENIFA